MPAQEAGGKAPTEDAREVDAEPSGQPGPGNGSPRKRDTRPGDPTAREGRWKRMGKLVGTGRSSHLAGRASFGPLVAPCQAAQVRLDLMLTQH